MGLRSRSLVLAACSAALVWAPGALGRPGYSGGSCNGGPLSIGSWFERGSLMFGKYATDWILPPRNTVNGHVKRYRARVLAGDQYQP